MDDAGKSGKEEFWFNSQTKQVEVGKQSLAIYRIGPFNSSEDALKAYEVIRLRNKAWDDADGDWDSTAND